MSEATPEASDAPTVFRPGGVSYLRIPAPDPSGLASFYEAVFGWRLHDGPASGKFEDATGHVIGHFIADLDPAGESGVRPYIYVDSVAGTLDALTSRGGEIVTPPYAEGDLTVATFRDPAGNVLGVWQRGAGD